MEGLLIDLKVREQPMEGQLIDLKVTKQPISTNGKAAY